MPGPRYEASEVRLALSNEALKTSGTDARLAIAASARARSTACASLSITHGPMMKASGCPVPKVTGPADTGETACTLRLALGDGHADRAFTLFPALRGLDETGKERVRLERPGLELGVELHRHEPRV